MAEKACVKRLQKEYRALCKDPVSHVVARPSPSDILEWHYVLEGSQGTPFAGGYYYGKIKFPPSIRLSLQESVHPESWNPMWSVSSILTGLLSFMMDNSPTTGSVNTTVAEKQRLAKSSLAFNCKNTTFRKMFPEYVEKYEQQQLAEQPVVEQVTPAAPRQQESSRSVLDKNGDTTKEEVNRVEAPKDAKQHRRHPFPTWMLLLIVSFVGIVMALPLLQL